MRRLVLVVLSVSILAVAPAALGGFSPGLNRPFQLFDQDKQNSQGKGSKDSTSTPNKQGDQIQLESKLVSLTVTVSDPLGRFVTGLTKRNFQVFDDGVKQEIAHFSDEDAPITLGFIYDVSNSMGGLTGRAFETLRRFFDTSHEDDEYFIIAFNDRPKLVQDFTRSPTEITSRVIFVKAKGSTALYDAVYLGIEKAMQGRHQKRALLIISDGEENSSRYSHRELRERLKEADVPVYGIAVKQLGYGAPVLRSLSGDSGGTTFYPDDEPQTRDIYTRIALMLRHQYAIGFYPTDAGANLDWHKVKITVSGPKGLGRLSVNYKKGYRSFTRP